MKSYSLNTTCLHLPASIYVFLIFKCLNLHSNEIHHISQKLIHKSIYLQICNASSHVLKHISYSHPIDVDIKWIWFVFNKYICMCMSKLKHISKHNMVTTLQVMYIVCNALCPQEDFHNILILTHVHSSISFPTYTAI